MVLQVAPSASVWDCEKDGGGWGVISLPLSGLFVPGKVLMALTGAYKYLQTEFSKYGLISPYICITVITSLANTINAHGWL